MNGLAASPVPHMALGAVWRVRWNQSIPMGQEKRESRLLRGSPMKPKRMPLTAYLESIKKAGLRVRRQFCPPSHLT